MNTCLYRGHVLHDRPRPVRHAFRKSLWMAYLDLAEVEEAFRRGLWFRAERPAPAGFRRADHLGDAGEPLDRSVRALVAARTGHRPEGPVRLLTLLRSFGVGFNPVSFFYCFDPTGGRLEALVAEVTSTPWRERHCYVLGPDVLVPGGPRPESRKALHVSPFMGMDQRYRWRVGLPGERLFVGIESVEAGRRAFAAALRLERRPWTAVERARAVLRHPAMALEVVAAIYWQALRLRLAGAPFHPHPAGGSRALETSA